MTAPKARLIKHRVSSAGIPWLLFRTKLNDVIVHKRNEYDTAHVVVYQNSLSLTLRNSKNGRVDPITTHVYSGALAPRKDHRQLLRQAEAAVESVCSRARDGNALSEFRDNIYDSVLV